MSDLENIPDVLPEIDKSAVRLGDDGELPDSSLVGKDKKKKRGRGPFVVRHLRRYLVFSIVLVLMIGVGYTAARFSVQHVNNQSAAQPPAENAVVGSGAENPVSDAQSLELATQAEQALQLGNPDVALKLAVKANTAAFPSPAVQRALIETAYGPGTRRILAISNTRKFMYSADGKSLITVVSEDRKVTFYDAITGQIVRNIMLDDAPGNSRIDSVFALSPNLSFLASQGITTTKATVITLWSLKTGKVLRQISGITRSLAHVTFSQDSTMLISGGMDTDSSPVNVVQLWDVATGRELSTLNGRYTGVTALAFSPDQRLCLALFWDGWLYEWNVSSGTLINQFKFDNTTFFTGGISPSTNRIALISFSASPFAKIWQRQDDGTFLPMKFDASGLFNSPIAFSPNDTMVATSGFNGATTVWDTTTAGKIAAFVSPMGRQNGEAAIAFSPDNRSLLAAADSLGLREWRIAPNGQLHSTTLDNVPTAISISGDGKMLSIGIASGDVIVQDANTGTELKRLPHQNAAIASIAFSPDGHLIAVGTSAPSGQMTLWDAQSGALLRTYIGTDTAPSFPKVVFSPDGTELLTPSAKGVSLWSINVSDPIAQLDSRGKRITSVSFSADGKSALVGTDDGQATIWDLSKRMDANAFYQKPGITSVAFSADGLLVAAGSVDGTISVWNKVSGNLLQSITNTARTITKVSFTSDSRYLVAASEDSTNNLTLWDVAAGAELYRFPEHTDAVNDFSISPDDHTLYTASRDGTVQALALPGTMNDLRNWIVQNRYVDAFTCDERQQYKILPLCLNPTQPSVSP